MAAALECWSGRPSTDEDLVEQVLMKNPDRSEMLDSSSTPSSSSSSPSHPNSSLPPKKWHRLLSNTLTSLKNNLLDSSSSHHHHRLDKLLLPSLIRRHFDSLPNSYTQAGFDMKDVLLHVKLIEQATSADDHPALNIEEIEEESDDSVTSNTSTVLKISFACCSSVSWPAMSGSLDGLLISCKKIQIFEKKGVTLGVAVVVVESGSEKQQFKARIENAIRSASKRSARNGGGGVKLPFGLCGCQEESSRSVDDDGGFDGDGDGGDNGMRSDQIRLSSPLPETSIVVAVDEWQTVRSVGEEIARWMLTSDEVEFVDRTGANSFKGVCRGKKVWIKKLRGCERGNAYEFEVRQDLLQLMSCGQRNVVQFVGVCVDESNGLCVVTRMMDGGSVHDLIQRRKKMGAKEVMRIALDVAEGLMFVNSHGVAYRDLNAQRILLDRQGNASLGDMGLVTSCNNVGEVTEYETAGYRWLAPEVSNISIRYRLC